MLCREAAEPAGDGEELRHGFLDEVLRHRGMHNGISGAGMGKNAVHHWPLAEKVEGLGKFRVTVCQRGLQDDHAPSAVSAIALALPTP
jgi:hypothetical protein